MNDFQGKTLLQIARNSVDQTLHKKVFEIPKDSWLWEWGATFVTLSMNKELRGCVGSIQAHRPLGEDVSQNAISAGFHDSRFSPLTLHEWENVFFEVSLLSELVPLKVSSEEDLFQKLKPFEDGLVLQLGFHRATFLPQVWEKLPSPKQFVGHLKVKAGLFWDQWSDQMEFSKYSLQKWCEEGFEH